MIPSDEARLAVEYKDHYIIRPSQRCWTSETPYYEKTGQPCARGFSYTSDSNSDWLTPPMLRDLIQKCREDSGGQRPDKPQLKVVA